MPEPLGWLLPYNDSRKALILCVDLFDGTYYSFQLRSAQFSRTVPIPTGGKGRVPGSIFGSSKITENLSPEERYIYVSRGKTIFPLRRKGSLYGLGYDFTIQPPGGRKMNPPRA